MGVRFINDVIGGAAARFTDREEVFAVELHIPDVVQRLILRADLLHALGKLADVVVTIPNCRVVLVDKPTYPFSRFPVGVGDSDAPAVREMEQRFIVAVDKADVLFFGHISLLFKRGKYVS